MNPLVLAVALSGFVFMAGLLAGALAVEVDARRNQALTQQFVLLRRQRQLDVLLALRELIDTGDTAAACQLIDSEVAR